VYRVTQTHIDVLQARYHPRSSTVFPCDGHRWLPPH
jgi:hypothetical protein